jgi:hypothetical protein
MPDPLRGRRSTYEHSKTAAPAPGDELQGQWSWLQLEAMNALPLRHGTRDHTRRGAPASAGFSRSFTMRTGIGYSRLN